MGGKLAQTHEPSVTSLSLGLAPVGMTHAAAVGWVYLWVVQVDNNIAIKPTSEYTMANLQGTDFNQLIQSYSDDCICMTLARSIGKKKRQIFCRVSTCLLYYAAGSPQLPSIISGVHSTSKTGDDDFDFQIKPPTGQSKVRQPYNLFLDFKNLPGFFTLKCVLKSYRCK